MDTDKRIADLVALGTDGLTALDRIPATIAQILARRWLIEAARDAERKAARAIEEAAARETYAEAQASRAEQRASYAASEAWLTVQPDAGILTSYDVRRFVERVYLGGDREEALAYFIRQRREFCEIEARASKGLLSELSTIIRDGVDAMIEERAASLGIEWTSALLTTTFSLPDGTRVEWGEAAVFQHAARLRMLKKHAATELETAARHQAAINALEAAGVYRLNDLP